VCPSPKTVAQLIAVLGAIVISGAFVEGHTALPFSSLKLGAQTLAAMAMERKRRAKYARE
jgi:hypothetical protein